jgi:hypothetical protein
MSVLLEEKENIKIDRKVNLGSFESIKCLIKGMQKENIGLYRKNEWMMKKCFFNIFARLNISL